MVSSPFFEKGKRKGRIKFKDLIIFNRKFSVLIKAGLQYTGA
jgi:hypothetical protein